MALSKDEIVALSVPYERITGIYFLIDGEEIVYVGQSLDIFTRIQIHKATGKVFDRYYYIECEESALNELEAEHIVKFAPKYNSKPPYNSSWRTLKMLKRDLDADLNEIKRYIKQQKIVSTNGYYHIDQFADFIPFVCRSARYAEGATQ